MNLTVKLMMFEDNFDKSPDDRALRTSQTITYFIVWQSAIPVKLRLGEACADVSVLRVWLVAVGSAAI
jgi:hypothetical protein